MRKIVALLALVGLLAFCVFAHGRQEASDGKRYRAEIARLGAELGGLRSLVAAARDEAKCWLDAGDESAAASVLDILNSEEEGGR
jgi:hypothetical protein